MNHLKEAVKRQYITHFLTYADNYAIGYFRKQVPSLPLDAGCVNRVVVVVLCHWRVVVVVLCHWRFVVVGLVCKTARLRVSFDQQRRGACTFGH